MSSASQSRMVAVGLALLLLLTLCVALFERGAVSGPIGAGNFLGPEGNESSEELGFDERWTGAGDRQPAIDGRPRSDAARSDAEGVVRFDVRVVSAEFGSPLSGAIVKECDGGALALPLGTTDGEGVLAAIEYRGPMDLMISAKGLASALVPVSELPEELVTVRLDAGGLLSGRVTASDGEPLANEVSVTAVPVDEASPGTSRLEHPAFWGPQFTTETVAGRFTISGVDEKTVYRLYAAGPGYLSAQRSAQAMPGGQEVDLTVDYLFVANAHLEAEGAAEGCLTSNWARTQSVAMPPGMHVVNSNDEAWRLVGLRATADAYKVVGLHLGNAMIPFRAKELIGGEVETDFKWGAPGVQTEWLTVRVEWTGQPGAATTFGVTGQCEGGGDLLLGSDSDAECLPADAEFWLKSDDGEVVYRTHVFYEGQRLPIRLQDLPVGLYQWGLAWRGFLQRSTGVLEHRREDSELRFTTDIHQIRASSGQVLVTVVDGKGDEFEGMCSLAMDGPYPNEPLLGRKLHWKRLFGIQGPRYCMHSLKEGYYTVAVGGSISEDCQRVVRVEHGETASITVVLD